MGQVYYHDIFTVNNNDENGDDMDLSKSTLVLHKSINNYTSTTSTTSATVKFTVENIKNDGQYIFYLYSGIDLKDNSANAAAADGAIGIISNGEVIHYLPRYTYYYVSGYNTRHNATALSPNISISDGTLTINFTFNQTGLSGTKWTIYELLVYEIM